MCSPQSEPEPATRTDLAVDSGIAGVWFRAVSAGAASTSRQRAGRAFVGVLASALLFAPAIAFLAGARGRPIENRASAPFPGVDAGWGAFTALGRYLSDRLPLRTDAVNADAWIDETVYREDPAFGGGSTPRVIRGADGFLFLADAIDVACAPNGTVEESVANLARLASIIDASGRSIVTMVAPDKSSVHPELLPADLAKRACFDAFTSSLWQQLNETNIPGFFDLRAALTQQSANSREPLYLRKDSHWDSAGSLVAVEHAVDHFNPGLWDPTEVSFNGLTDYTGDLTGMQGTPELDQAPMYSIVRPGVTLESTEVIDDIEGGFNRQFINSAPPGRLIPGKSLMFLDSYGLAALPQLQPFFEDLTVMRLIDYNPDTFAALIEASDNVWFMTVERSITWRLTQEIGAPAFLDQLEATLTPRGNG